VETETSLRGATAFSIVLSVRREENVDRGSDFVRRVSVSDVRRV